MKPTVGRIVHYTNLGDKDPCANAWSRGCPGTQAALITAVHEDGTVSLHIFYEAGHFDMFDVPYSDAPKRGHWHWPPR